MISNFKTFGISFKFAMLSKCILYVTLYDTRFLNFGDGGVAEFL